MMITMVRAGFLSLALLLPAGMAHADMAKPDLPGWQVIKTTQSYQELIESLNAAVEANQMGVVTRASATVGAARMLNQTIPGNMVVGVYRPDYAVRMLEASVAAGIEAPIRFYITENDDGTATLSYVEPTTVFAPYKDGGEALVTMAQELDALFAKIASEATKN